MWRCVPSIVPRRDRHLVEEDDVGAELALQHPAHLDDVVVAAVRIAVVEHRVAVADRLDRVRVLEEEAALEVQQVVLDVDRVLPGARLRRARVLDRAREVVVPLRVGGRAPRRVLRVVLADRELDPAQPLDVRQLRHERGHPRDRRIAAHERLHAVVVRGARRRLERLPQLDAVRADDRVEVQDDVRLDRVGAAVAPELAPAAQRGAEAASALARELEQALRGVLQAQHVAQRLAAEEHLALHRGDRGAGAHLADGVAVARGARRRQVAGVVDPVGEEDDPEDLVLGLLEELVETDVHGGFTTSREVLGRLATSWPGWSGSGSRRPTSA